MQSTGRKIRLLFNSNNSVGHTRSRRRRLSKRYAPERIKMNKIYKLFSPNNEIYESSTPGEFGGNKKAKIYGKLTCTAANRAISKGYAQHRVFFENEAIAIAAGFRPCGRCMKEQYVIWAKGGTIGGEAYPWKILPKKKNA